MERLDSDLKGEGITIDIGGSEGDGESRLFRSGEGLVVRNRGIIDRSDGDGDSSDVGVLQSVVGLVGKGIGTMPVEIRLVGEGTIRSQSQGAMGGICHKDSSEGIAIDVGVIGQHTGCVNGQEGILIRLVGIIDSNRGIVDRSDGDGDDAGIGAAVSVTDREGEAVGAVVVERRSVGQAGGSPGEGAVERLDSDLKGEGITIDIGGSDAGDGESRLFRSGEDQSTATGHH